jgi:hypothetical protein
MAEEFVTRVRDQLRSLRVQDDQLAATEEGIQRKRAELGARIQAYERSLEVYREVMGEQNEAKPPTSLFGEDDQKGLTIAEMAQAIIARGGGEARIADIAKELIRVGKVKDEGRTGYATVYSILNRDRRFRRVGGGVFSLASWNGGPIEPQPPSERSPDASPG